MLIQFSMTEANHQPSWPFYLPTNLTNMHCLHRLGKVCTQFQEKTAMNTFSMLSATYNSHSSTRHVHNLRKSQLYTYLVNEKPLVLPLWVTEVHSYSILQEETCTKRCQKWCYICQSWQPASTESTTHKSDINLTAATCNATQFDRILAWLSSTPLAHYNCFSTDLQNCNMSPISCRYMSYLMKW